MGPINNDDITNLLELQVRSLTEQKMNNLKEFEIKLKKEEINLSKKTSRDIWVEDLQDLKNILSTEQFNLSNDTTTTTKRRPNKQK